MAGMRRILPLRPFLLLGLLTVLALTTICPGPEVCLSKPAGAIAGDFPDSPWALARALSHAYQAHDAKALRSLICWDRADSTIRARTQSALDQTVAYKKISIRFKPLTIFDQTAAIMEDGTSRTYRYNLERDGYLEITDGSRDHGWAPSVGHDDAGYRLTLWSVTSEPFWQSDFNRHPTPREWLNLYYRDDYNARGPNTYLFRDSSDMAGFYRDVLAQALEDEKHDIGHWRTGFYYPVRNPQGARGRVLGDLEGIMGDRCGYYPFKPYASYIPFPAIAWCLSEESDDTNQQLAMSILERIDPPHGDSLVVTAFRKGIENPSMATLVLNFAKQRRTAVPRDVLRPYLEDHRPSVVMAARGLNETLGYPKAPVFKPSAEGASLADVDQESMGTIHGYRMIIEFAGNRDYRPALKEAQLIAAKYPRSYFGDMAKEMIHELPLRTDDFETLRLPTPVEWTKLRSTMSREEQIRYLCDRLRLLNDSPGGGPWGPQFLEAPGMESDAATTLNQGKTPVINPLIELSGASEEWWSAKATQPGGLRLTRSDVPILAPFLRDNWFLGCVDGSRFGIHDPSMFPERTLLETRDLILDMIKKIAPEAPFNNIDFQLREELDEEKAITNVIDWGAAVNTANEEDQVLKVVNNAQSYWEVLGLLDYLVAHKMVAAVPRLLSLIGPDSFPARRGQVLSYCRRIDAARCLPFANEYLMDPDPEIRLNAGLIVYASGAKMSGLLAIAGGLEYGACRNTDNVRDAATLLLANNGSDERDVAQLTLDCVRETLTELQLPLVRTFSSAHHPAGLELFLQELNSPSLDTQVHVAKLVLDSLMKPGESPVLQFGDTPEKQSAAIAVAKEWVTRQIAEMTGN